jgi:elongation factor Ts
MNLNDIKRLRELTGCGVMEARRALEAAGGDVSQAAEAVQAEQRDRPPVGPAQAGGVFQYRHHDGCLGSMVVLACGTDFVARSPLFRELGAAVALHVAAMAPVGIEELLAQPFVKDGTRTIGRMVAEVAARTGEAIVIRELFRCQV